MHKNCSNWFLDSGFEYFYRFTHTWGFMIQFDDLYMHIFTHIGIDVYLSIHLFCVFIFIYIYLSYVFMISFGVHDCVISRSFAMFTNPYQLYHVTTVSDHRVYKMNLIRNLDIGSTGNVNIAYDSYNSTRLSKVCARVLRKTWLYRWHCFQCTTRITSARDKKKVRRAADGLWKSWFHCSDTREGDGCFRK